jgi:hypothetical protein
MPRRLTPILLTALTFLLPFTARAQDTFRIDDVGLQGFFVPSVPTPVRVHVPALPQSQSVQLEFLVEVGSDYRRREAKRVDRFKTTVQMKTNEALDFDAPILISTDRWMTISVAARTSAGVNLGHVERDIQTTDILSQQQAVAIYCTSDERCSDARSQIESGTSGFEGARGGNKLRIVVIHELRDEWWAYGGARAIVLTAPMSRSNGPVREALERYVRAGGTLLLLEDEIADKDFLASYRRDSRATGPIWVGRGDLYRGSSLKAKTLPELAHRALVASPDVYRLSKLPMDSGASSILNRVGLAFTFPRLRWLIVWLALYIPIVGPLNFAILNRVRKREWGWISVCAIALVFAGGLYLVSSARRPKSFTIDSVALFWLDRGSPLALKEVGVRVSSPDRESVPISLDDDLVVMSPTGASNGTPGSSGVNFGSNMTDKRTLDEGWDVEFGRPLIINASMRRWSSVDLFFDGFHSFGGSVHWTSTMRLRNDTGINFREGIYIDSTNEKEYLIGQFVSGSEVDLTQVNPRPLYAGDQKLPGDSEAFSLRQFNCSAQTSVFTAADIPCAGLMSSHTQHLFVGLSGAPVPAVNLSVPFVPRSQLAAIIVDLDTP